ncbi:MAG: hypothetical protein RMM51_04190 [Verrucomicrobiae bacterium]|nr:hypothetical protein [Verrucomicrobiae bacterium]
MWHRNRRRQPWLGGTIARALLVCLYAGGLGIGYVWNQNQIHRLGDEIKKREQLLAQLERRNAWWAAQLAQLRSPAQLELFNRAHQLGLVPIRENQTVRVWEPTPAMEAQWWAWLRAQAGTQLVRR